MIGPYKMVLVNVIASFLLLIGVTIYTYIFPKKKINLFILLLIISILPIISVFRAGTYESGDLSLHAKISMVFYNNLKDGNIIPRWGSEFNSGYGSPIFSYFYLLPYYFISFFHLIGFSFINSIKLLLIISYISSGLGIYLWIKTYINNKKSAFFASIIYLFFPYHLVNLHFRVDIAEIVTFAIIPFILFTNLKNLIKISSKWHLTQTILLTMFIFSHQAISLATFPFLIIYSFYLWLNNKNRSVKQLIWVLSTYIFSILISSFYWIPIILEKKYVLWGVMNELYFPKTYELIFSPWRYGFLYQGPKGQLSYLIGYIGIFIFLASIYLIIKSRKNNTLIFFTICFAFIFFMMQEISRIIWNFLPLIKYFQFATRLLVLEGIFVSAMAGLIINKIKSNLFFLTLCFLAIFTTILNWGNRKTIPEINDNAIYHELINIPESGIDLTLPIWAHNNIRTLPRPPLKPIEIISGNGKLYNYQKKSTKRSFQVNADSVITIQDNNFYFPGWSIKDNNKYINFNYDKSGLMVYNLNKGEHKITVEFQKTNLRYFLMLASYISLIIYLLFIIVINNKIRLKKIKF